MNPNFTPPQRRRSNYAAPSQRPLTHKQKGIICQIAARAWTHLGRPGATRETWRRAQQHIAIGLFSLTDAVQDHYLPLVAHFEGLCAEGGRQFQAAYRHADEALRQQRHLLDETLALRGLSPAYADKICRDQYKRGLDDPKTTPDQLARIKFTVEARRPLRSKQAPIEAEAEVMPF